MSYPGEEDHRDYPIDSDIAEDALDAITRLQEQVIELQDAMVRLGADRHDVLGLEDAFNDALAHVWRENRAAGVSITYSEKIPDFDVIRMQMRREAMQMRLRPVPTNPATSYGKREEL